MGTWTSGQHEIWTNELDFRKCNEEVKKKSKSKSLTNAEWHEYVRNLYYDKNNLNLRLKGGTQKSAQKKIIFDQNTNDSLYLCGGEKLWLIWYIKRGVSILLILFEELLLAYY